MSKAFFCSISRKASRMCRDRILPLVRRIRGTYPVQARRTRPPFPRGRSGTARLFGREEIDASGNSELASPSSSSFRPSSQSLGRGEGWLFHRSVLAFSQQNVSPVIKTNDADARFLCIVTNNRSPNQLVRVVVETNLCSLVQPVALFWEFVDCNVRLYSHRRLSSRCGCWVICWLRAGESRVRGKSQLP